MVETPCNKVMGSLAQFSTGAGFRNHPPYDGNMNRIWENYYNDHSNTSELMFGTINLSSPNE